MRIQSSCFSWEEMDQDLKLMVDALSTPVDLPPSLTSDPISRYDADDGDYILETCMSFRS
jgi:hypothetical protein